MSTDAPKDPTIERIEQAREQRRAEADSAAGEAQLVKDFQREADKRGDAEIAEIERMLVARCEQLNAKKSAEIPDFVYRGSTHELRAGNFALILELTNGYSPYFFKMVSGLRHDAAQ